MGSFSGRRAGGAEPGAPSRGRRAGVLESLHWQHRIAGPRTAGPRTAGPRIAGPPQRPNSFFSVLSSVFLTPCPLCSFFRLCVFTSVSSVFLFSPYPRRNREFSNQAEGSTKQKKPRRRAGLLKFRVIRNAYSLCNQAFLASRVSSSSSISGSGTQQSTGQTAAHCGSS